MNPKRRPNHRRYLEVLRKMTPEQRLRKAFELTEFSRALFLRGLETRFPDTPPEELHRIYLDRLTRSQSSVPIRFAEVLDELGTEIA